MMPKSNPFFLPCCKMLSCVTNTVVEQGATELGDQAFLLQIGGREVRNLLHVLWRGTGRVVPAQPHHSYRVAAELCLD